MTNLRQSNHALNLQEFHEGALVLESNPTVVFVELTQNCNLTCTMCRSAGANYATLNMGDELFDEIAKQLFPTAMMVDLRGWGESTIRPDFEEKVQKTIYYGPQIRLVTNALSLRQSTWRLLMNSGAQVTVSVDAVVQKTANKLNRGCLVRLKKSLEDGAANAASAAVTADPTINFNTVVSSVNILEIPAIIAMAAEFQVRRVTLFPVVAPRGSQLHIERNSSNIGMVLADATHVAREGNVELRIGASLDEEHVNTGALPTRCSHPWSYAYISYAGAVGYCDHLIGHESLTLGRFVGGSFTAIWNNPAFQALRTEHRRHNQTTIVNRIGCKAFKHCNWCYRRRYVDFEDEIHPSSFERVVGTSGHDPTEVSIDGPFLRDDFLNGGEL